MSFSLATDWNEFENLSSHPQLKLGLILPNAEHITTLLGNEKPAVTTDKDPNVLALSKNDYASGYFPLLPVTHTSKTLNPGKSSVEEEKVLFVRTGSLLHSTVL